MTEIHELICIACPVGCQIKAQVRQDKIISIEGNQCKRGEIYTQDEIFRPARVVTSTVRVQDAALPVVPCEQLSRCLKKHWGHIAGTGSGDSDSPNRVSPDNSARYCRDRGGGGGQSSAASQRSQRQNCLGQSRVEEENTVTELERQLAINPIIAVIRDDVSFELVLKSPVCCVLLAYGELVSVGAAVRKAIAAEKLVFLNFDLIDGFGSDQAAVRFVAQRIRPHGIRSSAAN